MSDIACSCDYDCDGSERPSVYRESWRTARIPHTCSECGETIPAGVRYLYRTGKWDSEWFSFTSCQPCERVRAAACPCAPFGELDGVVRELFGIGLVDDPADYDDEEEAP